MIVIETVDVEELIDACDDEHEHAALNHATRLWSSVCPATIVTHALCVEPDLTLIRIPAVSSMIYMQNGGK